MRSFLLGFFFMPWAVIAVVGYLMLASWIDGAPNRYSNAGLIVGGAFMLIIGVGIALLYDEVSR